MASRIGFSPPRLENPKIRPCVPTLAHIGNFPPFAFLLFSDACKTVFLRAPGKDANGRSGEKRQPGRGEISVVRSLKYGRPFSLLPSFRGPHVSSLSPLAAYAIHEANRYSQRRQKERPLVHSPINFYLGSPILFLWYIHILHTRFFSIVVKPPPFHQFLSKWFKKAAQCTRGRAITPGLRGVHLIPIRIRERVYPPPYGSFSG